MNLTSDSKARVNTYNSKEMKRNAFRTTYVVESSLIKPYVH